MSPIAVVNLTFRPLSRGRYRCIQTDEIIKNPKSYRWSKTRSLLGQTNSSNRQLENRVKKLKKPCRRRSHFKKHQKKGSVEIGYKPKSAGYFKRLMYINNL